MFINVFVASVGVHNAERAPASTSPIMKFTTVLANDFPFESDTKENNHILLWKSRKLSSGKLILASFLSRMMRLRRSGFMYAGNFEHVDSSQVTSVTRYVLQQVPLQNFKPKASCI